MKSSRILVSLSVLFMAFFVSASMAQFNPQVVSDPQNPTILIVPDESLYFPGGTLSLRSVALQPGLPAVAYYTLRIERKTYVVPSFLGGNQPSTVIPIPGPYEQWVEVESHSVACHPGQPISLGPFIAAPRGDPFVRISVSETNEAWQPGLYRIHVKSSLAALVPQTIYFRVDSSAAMPVPELQAEKVAGGLKLRTSIPLDGWLAIVTSPHGVGVQRLQGAFVPLLQPVALEGPVALTLYNPYESGGREGGQETATFVVR